MYDDRVEFGFGTVYLRTFKTTKRTFIELAKDLGFKITYKGF